MKTLDDDIRDAFAELDESTPEGYFETLASRVDQRLEVEAMGPEMMSSEGNDRPPVGGAAGGVETHDEHSGLHDIKAMAKSTKSRISRRHSTQSDAEEALLSSASSASLSAIVLPEPGRDEEHYESEEPVAAAATSTARAAASTPARSGGMPVWVYGAVVVAAAAAGLVFYLTRGGGDKDQPTVAANEQGEMTPAAGAAAPAAPPSDTATATPAEDPAPSAADDQDGDEARGAGDEPAEEAPETATATGASGGDTAAEPVVVAKAEPKKATKNGSSRAASRARSSSSSSSKSAPAPAQDKAAAKKPKAAGDKRSLDDLLDEAAGGAKSNADLEDEKPAEPAKPAKTELSKSEIQAGMRKISGRVGACHDKYKESGNVMIKVEIAPDGSVTSAKATGKFANTETGQCVSEAVQKAKFPAWSGGPKRFSYPFLLSQ